MALLYPGHGFTKQTRPVVRLSGTRAPQKGPPRDWMRGSPLSAAGFRISGYGARSSPGTLEKEWPLSGGAFHTENSEHHARLLISNHANAWLAGAIRREDRLTGFGVINMDRDDVEAQVDGIPELGLRGIKMHPAFQRFALMCDKARRVYARAEALGLFISFHTGIHWHRISEYNMLLFDEVAFHYPALRFSLEHAGGYCFFNDAVAVLLNNAAQPPRIYAGMTSVCDRDMNRFWYLSDQQILDLIWLAGEDHLIFGLDFPYNDRQKIAQSIRRFEDMDLPDQTREKLFGGNIARALTMLLDQ